MKKILNALKGNGCQARMLTAAMTVLSAMAGLTSCANEDTALDNTTAQTAEGRAVQFTATLAPKGEAQPVLAEGEGDNGGQTRAITVNNQNTANETLNVAWQKDEEIAVYYEKTNGEHATATAKVTAVDNTGAATIETLSSTPLDDPKDGSEVTFIYPYSLAKNGEINKSILKNSQKGLLTGDNSISTNFDAAKGIATLSVAAAKAVTADRIKMKNQCCICKFYISFGLQQESSDATHYNISIVFDRGENYRLSSVPKDRLSALYVAMLPESSAQCTITITELKSSDGGQTATTLKTFEKIINRVTLAAGKFYNNVPITLTQTEANKTLTTATGELTLQHGDIVTGTGGGNSQLKIEDGATVTLAGVTNTSISHSSATSFAGIECLGNATIILAGENSVKGEWGKAGIYVPEGKTLTIRGGGKLTATANDGAGIGGNKGASCGNIVIEGGTINATGTGSCAGIGSGEKGSCGTITITGGNITATCGNNAAGIGSGKEGSCGNISISGSAQVTATGGDDAAGIGSGNAENTANTCGNISISGSAQVTATGGQYAAGIGSGDNNTKENTCGDISISGSAKVTATGGAYAAGIGNGHANLAANTCGDISISGSAQVTATGGAYAAGIGSGKGNNYSEGDDNVTLYVSSCGAISIEGGTIKARGGDRAAGIGSGDNGKFTSISITSGITRVTATRSNNFWNAPIGKGNDDQGSGGITIDGQTISDAMTKGTESLPTFPNLSITITGGKDSDNKDMANKTWTIQ